jgi:LPXTG-motif cell wall-anchored protein
MDFDVTTWILIVIIPASLGVGGFLLLRKRKPKEQPILYFRCPSCKRKLKYLARQAGHKGMCASCKEKFVFPLPQAAHR